MAQRRTQQQAFGPSQFRSLGIELYVGDLDRNVTKGQLSKIFRQIAPFVSMRVCRDLISGRNLGYAYVSYNTVQEATRALELLNFTKVNGQAIRVMFSNRDPTDRDSGKGNIFVKNLEKSIDGKALFDTFSPFGFILSCKVPTYPSGQSKGYGFVQFDLEQSAADAIKNVNGMLLSGKQVCVAPFVRRHERHLLESDDVESSKFTNVYVKNFSKYMTDEELSLHFGAFGTIRNAIVMRTSEGESKCFGFVNFEHSDDAARAVEALNGRRVDSEKEWYVGRAQTKSEREVELRAKFEKSEFEKYPFNLYVKNLEFTVNEEQLRDLFAEFGTITSCTILRDDQGRSKGFGFVAFSTAQAASHAISNMFGRMVRSRPLYVGRAETEEKRRAARLQGYGVLGTREAQFTQMRTPFSVDPANNPRTPGIGQQSISYDQQPPPALIPPKFAAFSNQQQMLTGTSYGGSGGQIRGQIPSFNVLPFVGRQVEQGHQRAHGERGDGGPQQQMVPRGGNRSHYKPITRPTSNVAESSQIGTSRRLDIRSIDNFKVVPNTSAPQASSMSALTYASALASTPPKEQRLTLGKQLYPMVDKLEHDHAQKVTGMLLQLDQAEVLHLMESPDALIAKVSEAMKVLRIAAI